MKNSVEVHINFNGGIISPGYLLDVLEVAASAGIKEVSFGLRQQLIMYVPGNRFEKFDGACREKGLSFERGKKKVPNIVSSYAAANIFTGESWLREGVYKDVFDLFGFTPKLKVNICDSSQQLVPFFTGHLNWLSSPHQHFWYLYIRFPHTRTPLCWPELVYTNDIAAVSQKAEEIILAWQAAGAEEMQYNIDALFQKLQNEVKYISKPVEDTVSFKTFYFPYYEGLNKDGANYWLGIYRRDEIFPVAFLMDICHICLETKIGQIYSTPWKSLIIKGIENTHRYLWDYVLGKHRINIRHAANELNWQVEDGTDEGLIVKRHVIRYFDKEDVRTYGLIFGVETLPSSNMFGSVIIRLRPNKRITRLKSLERYDILHTKDFNPNSKELVVYRDNVEKDFIGTYLVSLCKVFYEKESGVNPLAKPTPELVSSPALIENASLLYQCENCLTIYDETVGDAENNVAPGISFNELPKDYCCPLCATPKWGFVQTKEAALY